MVNIPQAAEAVLNIARSHGCGAQVTIIENQSKDVNVREGKIEQLLSSMALSTGVRLFKNNKSTIVSFSGDNFDNIEAKLKTALETIDHLGTDDAKRLLTRAEFGEDVKDLELDDGFFEDIEMTRVADILKGIETAGLGVSPKITPGEAAEFSAARSHAHLFSTEGLSKSFARSYYSFSYSAVAEDRGLKEVDYWYENNRVFKTVSDPAVFGRVGELAAQRALKRLGGKKIPSGEKPVVFSNRSAASLVNLLSSALDGEDILLRRSFLVDRLGEKLFPDHVTIMDDPFMAGYMGSYSFDGEGMNGKTKAVIEAGTLRTYLHNSYSAAKLGMELTGNASRTLSHAPGITCGNFYLESGAGTPADLLREMKNGLLVEDLFVSGMNDVTGNFSFGCSGFLVENGVATAPVKEITIAGNLLELFKNILVIADDNEFKRAVSSPSFLVSKLSIAGI